MILSGDIGGTKTVIGLFEQTGGRLIWLVDRAAASMLTARSE